MHSCLVLQKGYHREEFVLTVEPMLEDKAEMIEMLRRNEYPDDLFDLVTGVLRKAGERLFCDDEGDEETRDPR